MMRQYRRIKNENKDAVLFFRLGDFYEMFEEDAKEVSAILNITLTKRNNIVMCGIPYHAADNYIPRLLNAGKKIAICEQISLPENNKSIAQRKVVEIITPGTVVQEYFLDKEKDNYLIAIGKMGELLSFSGIDLSTGDFFCSSFSGNDSAEQLKRELYRTHPREIIIQETLLEEDSISRIIGEIPEIMINRFPDWNFDLEASYRQVLEQLKVKNLKGFGIGEENPALYSCGVLLEYIADTSKSLLGHINGIKLLKKEDFLGLDEATQKNLEIVKNQQDGSTKFTLFETLNFTKTASGIRQLKRWLLQPLKDPVQIIERQQKVEHFYHNQLTLSELREKLKQALDLQRLASKAAMGKAHGKDLLSIKNSLEIFFDVLALLRGHIILRPDWPDFDNKTAEAKELFERLEISVMEDASVSLYEGGLIKDGFSEELDSLRFVKKNSRKALENYLDEEKKKSGIQNLRIKYNKIIGYFIEVSKSYIDQVPDHFIKRQQLVNGDRFSTEKLGDLESEINNSSEKIYELEKTLFLEIRDEVCQRIPLLQSVSKYIAELDCLQSFAQAATVRGYIKPEVNHGLCINIKRGRHPVVEANLHSDSFIPNNLNISSDKKSFALITGPNMAGKSTYLRQTALIVLMAQAGSFVPAEEAEIGVVDQIFCRVGASDNLARGESTFLVEMNETAHILRSSSEKSLVIMDEVGRGTGTNDGLSIAWAVCEELLNRKIKTLFATHYHELTQLSHKNLENLSMETVENKDEIIFLKQVKKGSTANSYGIHVARLAGLPDKVINRAREVLSTLIKFEKQIDPNAKSQTDAIQESLFDNNELIINEIKSCKINETTPLTALNLIKKWQDEINP